MVVIPKSYTPLRTVDLSQLDEKSNQFTYHCRCSTEISLELDTLERAPVEKTNDGRNIGEVILSCSGCSERIRIEFELE